MKFVEIAGFLSIFALACGQTNRFPDNFKFGVATASYQIEGAWNVSDKGESIWDHLSHNNNWVVRDLSTGDEACDSYYLYKRDVEMLKSLGVDFYRFSLSWTRILPTGFSNKVSEDGLRYYNNLIDELLANGIEPAITLYHWDLPQSLQDLGGWISPFMVDYFVDYARVIFDNFGDRVKTWITFNEPYIICSQGYGTPTTKAPLVEMGGIADYICSKTLLLAHAKTYRLYHSEYVQKYQGRVGMADHISWVEPATQSPDDIEAAENFKNFISAWFYDPIYKGDYPDKMKELVAEKSRQQGYPRSRLPEFTEQDKQLIKGTVDFFGMNHYTTSLITPDYAGDSYPVPSLNADLQTLSFKDPTWNISTSSEWLSENPDGFRATLNWIKDRYENPEILVLENGYSTPPDAPREDDDRIQYYRVYLDAVLGAIYEDGCNITAYTAWSLMDNYEWLEGYSSRFGLFEVDFNSPEKVRRERKSALVFKEIIRSRVVDYSYNPILLN